MIRSPIRHTSQEMDNSSFDEDLGVNMVEIIGADGVLKNPATEAKQDAIVTAIEGITIDPPVGGATEEKQDSQISLETTLTSLIETLQELTQRLAPLAGAMSQTASLRVTPLTAPTTAVTGPITSAQSIAEKNVGGVSYPQRTAQENLTAIQSNINNVTI